MAANVIPEKEGVEHGGIVQTLPHIEITTCWGERMPADVARVLTEALRTLVALTESP